MDWVNEQTLMLVLIGVVFVIGVHFDLHLRHIGKMLNEPATHRRRRLLMYRRLYLRVSAARVPRDRADALVAAPSRLAVHLQVKRQSEPCIAPSAQALRRK